MRIFFYQALCRIKLLPNVSSLVSSLSQIDEISTNSWQFFILICVIIGLRRCKRRRTAKEDGVPVSVVLVMLQGTAAGQVEGRRVGLGAGVLWQDVHYGHMTGQYARDVTQATVRS